MVGLTGLSTEAQEGTPEPGRHHHRRDVEAHPLHAVVVRPWHGRDDGPGGTPVCLTQASVQPPWHPCDDADDRRLLEHCGSTAAKHPWNLGHPPQNTGRAVRVPVLCTFLRWALATAYRRRCAPAAGRAEPMGWPRWRRQLLEPTRDQGIVLAQRWYGIFPSAEFAVLGGGMRNDAPPGMGTRQAGLAQYSLTVLD